jgi:outer membrane protein TolC
LISLGLWNIPGETSAQETLLMQTPAVSSDSLHLSMLEFNIEQAELEVVQTNFLHRLMPQIHLTGSLGWTEIFFIDPSSSLLTYIPKDAYRLNVTLSVSDILDASGHRAAELKLERMRAELTRLLRQLQSDQAELYREISSLELAAVLDSSELSMKDEVLRFEEIRFAHGQIEFDALIRSRLDVLHAKKNLLQRQRRISDVRLKIGLQP